MSSGRSSLLCPRCRRLVSTDETACPYCGLSHPGAFWRRVGFGDAGVLGWILYANVLLFGLSLLLSAGRLGLSANPFAFLSPSDESLLLLGATGSFPVLRLHRWWSLLAANYLHGGLIHLAFNMMALRQIGPLAEQVFGPSRTLTVYTGAGVVGFLLSCLVGVPFTIGASAAVCGLIGAALYYAKSRGGTFGQALYSQLGGWVLGLFVFGLLFPGINNWGHGGGLVGGATLAWVLGYQERRRETAANRLVALCCAGATLAALGWGILSALAVRFLR